MAHNADNFRARVCDFAFEKGLDAKQFAERLGAKQLSAEPAEAWDGEGQGFPWQFPDRTIALIRGDGHEVARGGRNIAARIKRQYKL